MSSSTNRKKELSVYSDGVAVIGIGFQFPGGVSSLNAFWDLIYKNKNTVSRVPMNRWNHALYYDPNPDVLGKTYTEWGSFLEEDVALFDASFFSMTSSEATVTDPQQRLFLEMTWRALENAFLNPNDLSGTRTGVFAGVSSQDFAGILKSNLKNFNAYSNLGISNGSISGRVSYFFNLKGPSLTVDTASSSSLVCINQAVQNLKLGTCDLAIAGGVNLILTPENTIGFSKSKSMSIDGRCKTFDRSANGYVRGEGCGVIILKRMTDAVRDGDRVLAEVISTSINQDGQTPSMMFPSQESQEDLIREALMQAGIPPEEISYVETHGTGTPVGDPIEVGAIVNALCQNRTKKNPLVVGSVKANIGHLESAAGVAALIKAICIINNKVVPKINGLNSLNSKITEMAGEKVIFPQNDVELSQPNGKDLIIGINSFGITGTNAHLILKGRPAQLTESNFSNDSINSPHVLMLSARTKKSLLLLADAYKEFLANSENTKFKDICYSSWIGRQHFSNRVAIVASTKYEAVEKLTKYLRNVDGAEEKDVKTSKAKKLRLLSHDEIVDLEIGIKELKGNKPDSKKEKQLVFYFNDKVASLKSFGLKLYETNSTFEYWMNQCGEAIKRASKTQTFVVKDLFFDGEQPDDLKMYPLSDLWLFSFQYSLAQMWISLGLVPKIATGTGRGVIAAACISKAIDLKTAVLICLNLPKIENSTGGNGIIQFSQSESLLISLVSSKTGIRIGDVRDLISELFRKPGADFEVESWLRATENCTLLEIGEDSANSPLKLPSIGWIDGIQTKDEVSLYINQTISKGYVLGFTFREFWLSNGETVNKVEVPGYVFEKEKYWPLTENTKILPSKEDNQRGKLVKISADEFKSILFEGRINENTNNWQIFDETVFSPTSILSLVFQAIRKSSLSFPSFTLTQVEFGDPTILEPNSEVEFQIMFDELNLKQFEVSLILMPVKLGEKNKKLLKCLLSLNSNAKISIEKTALQSLKATEVFSQLEIEKLFEQINFKKNVILNSECKLIVRENQATVDFSEGLINWKTDRLVSDGVIQLIFETLTILGVKTLSSKSAPFTMRKMTGTFLNDFEARPKFLEVKLHKDSGSNLVGEANVYDEKSELIWKIDELEISQLDKQELERFTNFKSNEKAATEVDPLLHQVQSMKKEQRLKLFVNFILEDIAFQVGQGRALQINIQKPMRPQGIDSLMSIELRNSLVKRFRKYFPIPHTVVLDYPSVVELASFIEESLPDQYKQEFKHTSSDILIEHIAEMAIEDENIENAILTQLNRKLKAA